MRGARAADETPRWALRAPIVLAIALAVSYLPLIRRQNVNWDEFRFLSDVYEYQRGNLTRVLQSIHVHAFGWLPNVSVNEVDQVFAARMAYFVLLLGSCASLYLIGRRFYSSAASALVVVCYLSYAEVIRHGTSFRFDGLGIFLILAALALLLRTANRWGTFSAAVLLAIAHLVTIKSVFYLPAFVLVIVLTAWPSGPRRVALRVAGFAAVVAVSFFTLLTLHKLALGDADVAAAAVFAADAGERVISFDTALIRGLVGSIIRNAVIWYVLVRGLMATVRAIRESPDPRDGMLTLALATPILSVFIYRNAFPYYYVFLMGPVLIMAGRFFEDLLQASQRRAASSAGRFLIAAVTCILIGFGFHYARQWPDRTGAQRDLLATVHRLFPQEVAYIDRNSMVSSFPKVGFFMSRWGFENYHHAGKPIFADLIRRHQPAFLIANHPALARFDTEGEDPPPELSLLPEDAEVLRDNYLPFWGPLHLAGKRLRISAGVPSAFHLLVDGVYVLESPVPVFIDGVMLSPGSQVDLSSGRHTMGLASDLTDQFATLRLWTPAKPLPPPPSQPLYFGL